MTYKISGQLNKNNRLSTYLTWGRKELPFRNAASTYFANAVYSQTLLPWAGNVTYDGTITPKIVTTIRIGGWGHNWLTSVYGGANGQILPRQYEVLDSNYAGSFAPFRKSAGVLNLHRRERTSSITF